MYAVNGYRKIKARKKKQWNVRREKRKWGERYKGTDRWTTSMDTLTSLHANSPLLPITTTCACWRVIANKMFIVQVRRKEQRIHKTAPAPWRVFFNAPFAARNCKRSTEMQCTFEHLHMHSTKHRVFSINGRRTGNQILESTHQNACHCFGRTAQLRWDDNSGIWEAPLSPDEVRMHRGTVCRPFTETASRSQATALAIRIACCEKRRLSRELRYGRAVDVRKINCEGRGNIWIGGK